MKLSQSEQTALSKLAEKHSEVKKLIEFHESVMNNSAYESYIARRVTLSNWNADLIDNPVRLFSKDDADEEKAKSRDKEVDRVLKYLEKQTILHDQTEELRAKLTGEEQEAVNRDTRIKESSDRAFKGMKG